MTQLSAALRLADHVLVQTGGVDHLKLQKLCFYAYGAALAYNLDEIGEMVFEPWKHGPVNRQVWDAYKSHRAEVIPPPSLATRFTVKRLARTVDDVIDVYGRMSSWSIRCESHLEEPWARARRDGRAMTSNELREHFTRKFAPGNVTLPVYLGGASSAVDGIPSARFESLQTLAQALRKNRHVATAGA